MKLPPGYTRKGFIFEVKAQGEYLQSKPKSTKVFKLLKSLYGLK